MNINKLLRTIIILMIVITNISCDQLSKAVVREKITYNESIDLIKNHLFLTKIENTGAFLSFGDDYSHLIKYVVFMGLPLLFLCFMLVYVLRNQKINNILVVGICFVIGGGIGNIYDRIVHGSVTDFMIVDFTIFRTGIFNFADVSVMIGASLILWQGARNKIFATL